MNKKRKCLSMLHLQKESVFALHKRNHLLSEADYIFFYIQRDEEPFSKVNHLEATNLCSKDLNILGPKTLLLRMDKKHWINIKS